MKIHFIKSSLSLAFLSIALAGCLKDKSYNDGKIQSGSSGSGADTKTISLGVTVSDTTNFVQMSFDLTGIDTTLNAIPVELGGLNNATQDIHVTLAESDQVVADYNAANGTDFTNPGSYVTILNNVVTIPKGGRVGYLQLKFNPDDLLNGNFALGFVISSVAETGYTIANLDHGIIALGPKNLYDGLYSLRMKWTGWAAYGVDDGIPETWPSKVSIITTGLNSVILSTAEAGALQPGFIGGSIAAFGATEPQYTFDLSTNKLVSVTNLVPPDSRNRAFAINPAVTDSRYDPATKTMFLAYLFTQNGRPTAYIYDTLVYKGVR